MLSRLTQLFIFLIPFRKVPLKFTNSSLLITNQISLGVIIAPSPTIRYRQALSHVIVLIGSVTVLLMLIRIRFFIGSFGMGVSSWCRGVTAYGPCSIIHGIFIRVEWGVFVWGGNFLDGRIVIFFICVEESWVLVIEVVSVGEGSGFFEIGY
jgi:hypothetical protein